jgi:hypothetical protein
MVTMKLGKQLGREGQKDRAEALVVTPRFLQHIRASVLVDENQRRRCVSR